MTLHPTSSQIARADDQEHATFLAMEEALSDYREAVDDYMAGLCGSYLVSLRHAQLVALGRDAGNPEGSDPESFASSWLIERGR